MKGSEHTMLRFLEGASKRFIIPVYQRKYNWKRENCRQLYNDIKKVAQNKRCSHFLGSVVLSEKGMGSKNFYYIVDGQQRITTITLLLLAIKNLIADGTLVSQQNSLDKQINESFLISPYANQDDKIKLRPVQDDWEALIKLFDSVEDDFDKTSNLTLNYSYFCEMLRKKEVPVDDLFDAIGKLEIICVTLNDDDDAQLIFESLNSTGMALTEGDKIRNYILMGLTPEDQTRLFKNYWVKIEDAAGEDVSSFVRDYLSVKQQLISPVARVYMDFKEYAENSYEPGVNHSEAVEKQLSDMLKYARFYEKLLTSQCGFNNRELDDCLYRLNRLDIGVSRPFFMSVLNLCNDGEISVDDVLNVCMITESYLFRRNICEVPTNALNKVFVTLNKEILRYDGTAENYVDKCARYLMGRRTSARFPDNIEFTEALSNKHIYEMRSKYRDYIFERFENFGTVETKDVYTLLNNNVYTIEHIMPQQLSPDWISSLGTDYNEIHTTWLHRLANLTLSGYNSKLSNKTFAEKRDAPVGGYRVSGLRMNQKIAQKTSWGLDELQERNDEMVLQALDIWKYPKTDFKPQPEELDCYTLGEEDEDYTDRKIVKFEFMDSEQTVTNWTSMFERVVKMLHRSDRSVLIALTAHAGYDSDMEKYVSSNEADLRTTMKIDEHIYFESNTSTSYKIILLRRLFKLYGVDPNDLLLYVKG